MPQTAFTMLDFSIGPATRCDEMRHFAAILKLLEPSQPIAGISCKIAAVWPVSYPRWNVFIFSCDAHRRDSVYKYLTEKFESRIT